MSTPRSMLRAVGSLWFAVVLLILWLVSMACATVVESTRGTELALAEFYHAWWFQTLLVLLAVNLLAAVLLRLPLRKRHIGFALTHVGLLVTLVGAAVTQQWAQGGQVGLAENQTTDKFSVRRDALILVNRRDQARTSVNLDGPAFGGVHLVEQPEAPALKAGDLRVEVQRYLPDGEFVRQVTDDDPAARPAVEVALSANGRDNPTWLFPGDATNLGAVSASYRQVTDSSQMDELLNPEPGDGAASSFTVRIEYQGSTFDLPLEDCRQQAVPIGDTGYTVRVLRYLPHATVGPGNKVVAASTRLVNPAIEAELVGPAGSETRLAFARFPDFRSMHGRQQIEALELTFLAPSDDQPSAPVEVIGGPDGELYVRFTRDGSDPVVAELTEGAPVETPWPGLRFAVLRRFRHARVQWAVQPVNPIREKRTPALLVTLETPQHSSELWVLKHRPRQVSVDGTPYEVNYADQTAELGFSLKLNRFQVGYYPGTSRPRSFESQVTITDPVTGQEHERIIGMNNPTQYGGYSLFQSSYDIGNGQRISYLSVSRDPGLPIVFAGYICTLVGMVVVLITRLVDRRRLERVRSEAAGQSAAGSAAIALSVATTERTREPGTDGYPRAVSSSSRGAPAEMGASNWSELRAD